MFLTPALGVAVRLRLLRVFLLKVDVINFNGCRVSVGLLHDLQVERVLILCRPLDVLEKRLVLQITLHFAEVLMISDL